MSARFESALLPVVVAPSRQRLGKIPRATIDELDRMILDDLLEEYAGLPWDVIRPVRDSEFGRPACAS